MNSLTVEEIIEFTKNNLYDLHLLDNDDLVVAAWARFFERHNLSPLKEHEFVFTTRMESAPWEEARFDIRWVPEVVLGKNSFEYEKVYLGICPRRSENSANVRVMGFIPELGVWDSK